MVVKSNAGKVGQIEQEDRSYMLTEVVLRGLNQRDTTAVEKVPGIGKWIGKGLQKAAEYVPVAEDFTTKGFIGFYNSIEALLENYDSLACTERKLYTPAGLVTSLGGMRGAEQRDDPVKCGSYLKFESADKSLQGVLHIGYTEDRELVDREGTDLDMKTKVEWAVSKLKAEGVQGAADLVGARILAMAWGPLAVVGLGDLGRRAYNMAKFDAHWELELHPAKDTQVTKKQFEAYRGLLTQYSK